MIISMSLFTPPRCSVCRICDQYPVPARKVFQTVWFDVMPVRVYHIQQRLFLVIPYFHKQHPVFLHVLMSGGYDPSAYVHAVFSSVERFHRLMPRNFNPEFRNQRRFNVRRIAHNQIKITLFIAAGMVFSLTAAGSSTTAAVS